MAALSVAIQHRSMARDRSPKPRSLPSYVLIDDQSSNHKLLIVRRRIVRITNEVVEKKLISTIHLYLAGEPSNTLRAWWKKPAGEEPRASPSPGSRTIDVEATVELGRRAWSDVGGSGGEGVAWPWRCYDGGEKRPPTPATAGIGCGVQVGEVCGCGGGLGSVQATGSGRRRRWRRGRRCRLWRGDGRMGGCATDGRARGRTRAGVRAVSAPTQTRPKFGPEMGRGRTKNGRLSVCVGALGRDFCPFRPKRTRGQNASARSSCPKVYCIGNIICILHN